MTKVSPQPSLLHHQHWLGLNDGTEPGPCPVFAPRTSPCEQTVVPAVLFWSNTPLLMAFCCLFVVSYVMAYFAIVRFKVPHWLRH